jgi:hypothetical protein
MKIKLLVAAAATVVASSAMAQSAFEGAYGQVGIGYQSSKAKTDVSDISFNSTNGFASTVGAGYNFAVRKDFLLGIGAEYSFLPTSQANFTYDEGNGPETEKYKNQNTYNIFLSPGYAISKDSLAYAKLGYTGTTYKFDAGDSYSLNGYSLGLGYKQVIDGGLYGFAEGNYMSYNNKTLDSGIKLSGNSMNLLVGVGYKF